MKSAYVTALVLGMMATPALAEMNPDTASLEDKLSYSAGFNFGLNMRQQGIKINDEYLFKGINDSMAETPEPLFTKDQLVAAVEEWKKLQEEQKNVLAAENLKKGEAFLAENAKKDGVVTLESGLQYKVVTEGEGASPKATDLVTVHYRGTLVDGKEFDSSYSRGEPTSFKVGQVIPGWVEALQLMKKGAKWEVAIPANLAYGARGAGGAIGPNETLLFEVELLDFES